MSDRLPFTFYLEGDRLGPGRNGTTTPLDALQLIGEINRNTEALMEAVHGREVDPALAATGLAEANGIPIGEFIDSITLLPGPTTPPAEDASFF